MGGVGSHSQALSLGAAAAESRAGGARTGAGGLTWSQHVGAA